MGVRNGNRFLCSAQFLAADAAVNDFVIAALVLAGCGDFVFSYGIKRSMGVRNGNFIRIGSAAFTGLFNRAEIFTCRCDVIAFRIGVGNSIVLCHNICVLVGYLCRILVPAAEHVMTGIVIRGIGIVGRIDTHTVANLFYFNQAVVAVAEINVNNIVLKRYFHPAAVNIAVMSKDVECTICSSVGAHPFLRLIGDGQHRRIRVFGLNRNAWNAVAGKIEQGVLLNRVLRFLVPLNAVLIIHGGAGCSVERNIGFGRSRDGICAVIFLPDNRVCFRVIIRAFVIPLSDGCPDITACVAGGFKSLSVSLNTAFFFIVLPGRSVHVRTGNIQRKFGPIAFSFFSDFKLEYNLESKACTVIVVYLVRENVGISFNLGIPRV